MKTEQELLEMKKIVLDQLNEHYIDGRYTFKLGDESYEVKVYDKKLGVETIFVWSEFIGEALKALKKEKQLLMQKK